IGVVIDRVGELETVAGFERAGFHSFPLQSLATLSGGWNSGNGYAVLLKGTLFGDGRRRPAAGRRGWSRHGVYATHGPAKSGELEEVSHGVAAFRPVGQGRRHHRVKQRDRQVDRPASRSARRQGR